MKNALTKKDASEVKDVAESNWLSDEQLNELVANANRNNQTEAMKTLAAKFGAVDGAGEALSLVTAAVAVTASNAPDAQPSPPPYSNWSSSSRH